MMYCRRKILNFFVLVSLVVLINGCAPQAVKPNKICPGKAAVKEAFDTLKARRDKVGSFKAKGRCVAKFYERVKGRKKEHKESFAVRLWLNPPTELRFWGDIAFNARGLDIGSNKAEFWVAAKPKEIGNTFFWGRWDEQETEGNLRLNPEILLEGFGIVDCNDRAIWSLEKQGNFDVLVKKYDDLVIKKYYIERCDYRIESIEYFKEQTKSATIELTEYKQFFEGMVLPMRINIKSYGGDGTEDVFRIVLDSVQPFEVTEDSRRIFFDRPKEPKGFEHIYRIINGRLVEQ